MHPHLHLHLVLPLLLQTTPAALKEIIRDGGDATQGDRRRGINIATVVSKPFSPPKVKPLKKFLAAGKQKSCKGGNIGRRDNGQYESSSTASKGGGARVVKVEVTNLKLKKKKQVEDYGEY